MQNLVGMQLEMHACIKAIFILDIKKPAFEPEGFDSERLTYALPVRTGSNLNSSGTFLSELSYEAYYKFLLTILDLRMIWFESSKA